MREVHADATQCRSLEGTEHAIGEKAAAGLFVRPAALT